MEQDHQEESQQGARPKRARPKGGRPLVIGESRRAEPESEKPSRPTIGEWFDRAGSVMLRVSAIVTALGTAIGVVIVLVQLATYLWTHRGAVRLVPFEVAASPGVRTPPAAEIDARFGAALEDVALGSQTDMAVVPGVQVARDSGPPQVSLPGVGVSIDSIVGFLQTGQLAETHVRGMLTSQNGAYEVVVQVLGPAGVRTTFSSGRTTDLDEAIVRSAELTYGALRPLSLAAYLFKRDPERCLASIRQVLAAPQSSPADQASAYYIWGLVLRDGGDHAGAREKLEEAARREQELSDGTHLARIYVDLGHTHLLQGHTASAADAYRKAAFWAPAWANPQHFWGEALLTQGKIGAAIHHFRRAAHLDPVYAAPWNGLAQAVARTEHPMSQTEHSMSQRKALAMYTRALHLHLERDRTTALSYIGIGDMQFARGRDAEALDAYRRAFETDPTLLQTGVPETLGAPLCPIAMGALCGGAEAWSAKGLESARDET